MTKISTKIYDAYKINISTTNNLIDFVKSIKHMYLTRKCYPSYNNLLANQIENLTQYLLIHNNLGHSSVVQNTIISAANNVFSYKASAPRNLTFEDAIQTLSNISIYSAAKNLLIRNMYLAEIDSMLYSCDKDFNASIALFQWNRQHFIMVFGNMLQSLIYDIIASDDEADKEFCLQYGLKDYHYQNQTDRPENITAREWKKRKQMWDNLLPSGIPSKDGIIISIMDTDSLITNLSYDVNGISMPSIFANQKPLLERLESYVREITLDEECESKSANATPRVYSRFFREFMHKIETEDPEIMLKLNNNRNRIKPFMIDFNDNEIQKQLYKDSIIAFLNNHSDNNYKITISN